MLMVVMVVSALGRAPPREEERGMEGNWLS